MINKYCLHSIDIKVIKHECNLEEHKDIHTYIRIMPISNYYTRFWIHFNSGHPQP